MPGLLRFYGILSPGKLLSGVLLQVVPVKQIEVGATDFLPPKHWHDSCPSLRQRADKRTTPVKFAIEIGDTEKHRLEYNFNQLLGSLVIKVNEKPIKKSLRLINEPVLEIHAFVVGDQERSSVRIEKERKQLLGCRNRLYVNNRLVKVFEGI
jgi:hypothetical protein